MGTSKLYALVGAAMFFMPAVDAIAADIPEIPPPAQFAGGWYLRGHIGMAQQGFHGLEHAAFSDPAFFEWLNEGTFTAVPIAGLGIGYRHSEHLRFDVTGEYRGKSAFSAMDRYDTSDNPPDFGDGDADDWGTNHYTGQKSEWLFLANGYYDIATWHGITPYVGAGIGASLNTITGFNDENIIQGGGGWAPTGHQWNFAWALHAGASMQVTNNLSLDVGYSYVHLGDAKTGLFQNNDPNILCTGGTCTPMEFKGIYSHDFKVGLRWAFDTPQQSYYPPVVKY